MHTFHSRRLALSACALALLLPATAGAATIQKQTREVSGFNGLSLSIPGDTELRIGNTESVTIETDADLLGKIETVVENGTLMIRPIHRNAITTPARIKVVVQARAIERLNVGGSGSIVGDALKGRKISADIGGSGSISLRGVEAEAMTASIGGSGNLKVDGGVAHKLTVSIGGSGSVDLDQVRANEVSVNVAGSGEASVNARDTLRVSIAGSGSVNYYGDPKISKTMVGSGGIRRLGPVR